jgi:hypothetical protein
MLESGIVIFTAGEVVARLIDDPSATAGLALMLVTISGPPATRGTLSKLAVTPPVARAR